MHSRKPFDPSSYWQMVVHLTDQEWLDRSIRQWVYTNCHDGIFFSHDGVIYFGSMEDFVHFWLAWGEQSQSTSSSSDS